MNNIKSKIETIDSKIQKLAQRKEILVQNETRKILKSIQDLSLFEWDKEVLKNALIFLKTQKDTNSKLFQDWSQTP